MTTRKRTIISGEAAEDAPVEVETVIEDAEVESAAKTRLSGDPAVLGVVTIERGGWEIDPATVVFVEDRGGEDTGSDEPIVSVITNIGGSYLLTREEAAPFFNKD